MKALIPFLGTYLAVESCKTLVTEPCSKIHLASIQRHLIAMSINQLPFSNIFVYTAMVIIASVLSIREVWNDQCGFGDSPELNEKTLMFFADYFLLLILWLEVGYFIAREIRFRWDYYNMSGEEVDELYDSWNRNSLIQWINKE